MVVIEAGRTALSYERKGPHLTPRQKDILSLTARGLSRKQIAEQLGISIRTVKDHQRGARSFFGAENLMRAVFLALDQDELTYKEVVKGWDKTVLSKLTPRDIEVVDAMTINNGENISNKKIGDHLYITLNTVRSHLQSIRRKTKMNRMQIGILYAARKSGNEKNYLPPQEEKSSKQPAVLTPREMEVLVLTAKGFSRKEIADQLSISIKTVSAHRRAIYQNLGATNAAHAFGIALEMGILKLENPTNNKNSSPPFREVVVYQRRLE